MNDIIINKKKVTINSLVRILLLACFPILTINGQSVRQINLDVPRVVPVSPAASEMEKYQSYPVDYCTGVPNITIPLYEIVAGEITIPVTLTYHSSGIKPKERSGIAGTGWTLNLEPSISRQIKGIEDDGTYGWFNREYSYNAVPTGERKKFIYYGEIVDNKRDTQPDKFTYKLPHGGGSGYFIYQSQSMTTIPRNNDNVLYQGSNMHITDENGMLYEFNGVNEKTSDYVTRWLCTAIRSPHKDNPLVTFQYSSTPNVMNPNSFYNMTSKLIINERNISGSNPEIILTEQNIYRNNHYKVTAPFSMGDVEPYNAELVSISEQTARVHYPNADRFVSGYMNLVQLEEVNFMGNKLTMYYKASGSPTTYSKVVDRIEVTDENGNLVRNIKFSITPYNSRTSLTKLDTVSISAPGAETRTYSFRYDSESSVPSVYTVAVDHWGFCNGPTNSNDNQLTVPNFRAKLSVPVSNWNYKTAILNHKGINREPDHEWTKVGVLKQITNPQGIQTNFYYEGNYGAFRDNSQQIGYRDYLHPVGGLRIEHIEEYDPKTEKRITKRYTYGLRRGEEDNEPVWGGGAIKHIVTDRDYQSIITNIGNDPYSYVTWDEKLTTYHSMPISNITFHNGSAVTYSIVCEDVQDQNKGNLKTIYYYNADMHDYKDVLRWSDKYHIKESVQEFLLEQPYSVLGSLVRKLPGHPQEPTELVNGYADTKQGTTLLLKVEYYKDNQLVSSTKYEYDRETLSSSNTSVDIPIRLLLVDVDVYMRDFNDAQSRPVYVFNNYYNSPKSTYYLDDSYCYVLVKEINKEYRTVNGKQQIFNTEKEYAYDFNPNNPGSSLKPRQIKTTNSNGNTIIDKYDYLNGFPAILSNHRHIEKDKWNEARIQFRSGTSLPEKVQSRTDQFPDFRDEVVYTAYDTKNNVAEIMGKDGTPIVFLWGYRSQFPIAKIENATRRDVLLAMDYTENDASILGSWASMIEPTTEAWNKINSLRSRLPNSRVTSYEYKPLQGVVAITNPSGIITKFEYDGYNRLTDSYYLDADTRKVMLQQFIYRLGK